MPKVSIINYTLRIRNLTKQNRIFKDQIEGLNKQTKKLTYDVDSIEKRHSLSIAFNGVIFSAIGIILLFHLDNHCRAPIFRWI